MDSELEMNQKAVERNRLFIAKSFRKDEIA